jgi:hypothetical protein
MTDFTNNFENLSIRFVTATGISLGRLPNGDFIVSECDLFKLAALVELAQNPEPPPTQEELMHERVYGLNTVMGQPRERVAKDLADKRSAAEQEKLAEAGRKSWVTRRANAAKKGGRK